MSINNDYKTGNFLDYLYHQNIINSLVSIHQEKQNTSIPQQINFVGKLEENGGVTMFFIAEKQPKAILNFYLD